MTRVYRKEASVLKNNLTAESKAELLKVMRK